MGIGSIENPQLKDFVSKRNNAFVSFFKNRMRRSPSKQENIDVDEVNANYDSLVFGAEEERLDYKMSQCCNPIPGDKVFGFITINDGIKVHKKDCPNAISLQANYAYRILSAKWIDSTNQEFKAILKLHGVDHVGMVNEITEVISRSMSVDIHNLNISSNNGIFEGSITVSVKNKSQLQKLSDAIKKIDGIDKVDRINKH